MKGGEPMALYLIVSLAISVGLGFAARLLGQKK
jgi:hypothetical protein